MALAAELGLLGKATPEQDFTGSVHWRRFCRSTELDSCRSPRGNCWDRAAAESPFGSLNKEGIKKRNDLDRRQATNEISDYIGMLCSPIRRDRLGSEEASSWAPVWSPDGRMIAFYSDEGGTSGIWIWDRSTRTARRVPGFIARPIFGFEVMQWAPDSGSLYAKVLPEGVTAEEANGWGDARRAPAAKPRPEGEADPNPVGVHVRRVLPKEEPGTISNESTKPKRESIQVIDTMAWARSNLVKIDLDQHRAKTVMKSRAVRLYKLSPDGKHMALTIAKGAEANSQQTIFDLVVAEIGTGMTKTLGEDIRMAYGIEWSWSLDSSMIALTTSGQLANGELVVFSLDDNPPRTFKSRELPSLDPGDGELSPVWSGTDVFAIGGGELWQISVIGETARRVASIPGWTIRLLISSQEHSQLWPHAESERAWVLARSNDATKSGFFSVDLETGNHTAVLVEDKRYADVFNVSASADGSRLAFVSSAQHHPSEIWMLDTGTPNVWRASKINQSLFEYELGDARVIDWDTRQGKHLQGTLLIPPNYQPDRPAPLVVWVYGGAQGSKSVNRFGMASDAPVFNMQVLATRGYAVLYPDAPLGEGEAMADILDAVMPSVDKAIELGFADSKRLAVMGQSYGSYSALCLITQTNRFRAAVLTGATVHPDLLVDYLGSTGYYEHGQGNMGGSIWEFPERYLKNSPLLKFDRISNTPILIGQGDKDGDLNAAEAIFSALSRLNKPVEYRLYEGEGHVISNARNVLDFWSRRLEFLKESL